MSRLQIGDTIKCRDSEDMVDTDQELVRGGYETEFLYEMNGNKGYWIVITGIEEE